MEASRYRRWGRNFLLAVVILLGLCAAVVYRVDPCFYYRMPADRLPVFFNERYLQLRRQFRWRRLRRHRPAAHHS